jgi:hypothetical protein
VNAGTAFSGRQLTKTFLRKYERIAQWKMTSLEDNLNGYLAEIAGTICPEMSPSVRFLVSDRRKDR